MASVWIVEDDGAIAELVALYLRSEGHATEIVGDGAMALRRFEAAAPAAQPDLIVLDLMLPGLDGRGVARRIRQMGETPILMLTALDDARDKIEGLDLGADDYLTKPFNPQELLARVRAILRRSGRAGTAVADSEADEREVVAIGSLRIDVGGRRVEAGEDVLALRAKEFDLLLELARHPGTVLTRDRLLDRVWGGEYAGDTRTVDVTLSRLRERLSSVASGIEIETVRAVGYRLVERSAGDG